MVWGKAPTTLGLLGDMILGAGVNVTAVKEPDEVERVHFWTHSPCLSSPWFDRHGILPMWDPVVACLGWY